MAFSAHQPSYYEELKARILSQPFQTPEDEARFLIPLECWGKRKSYPSAFIQDPAVVRNLRGRCFTVVKTDVTLLPVEAVMNAANETLLGGGGIDECIHKAAGYLLLRECAGLQAIQPGQAVATKGYDLPAAYIIHTVAPLYWECSDALGVLRSCYQESLRLCEELGVTSFGLSPLGCGFYGCPVAEGSGVAVEQMAAWQGSLSNFVFAVHTEEQIQAYVAAVQALR